MYLFLSIKVNLFPSNQFREQANYDFTAFTILQLQSQAVKILNAAMGYTGTIFCDFANVAEEVNSKFAEKYEETFLL